MGGLSNAITTGASALQVNQKQIEITGSNIANVDTEGYSRQYAEKTPYPSINRGGFFIGQGVTITDVGREHNAFVNKQLTDKSVDFGFENSQTSSFSELERILSITDGNVSSKMDDFFDSWQELSANPTDVVIRDTVIQQGANLTEKFNNLADELDGVQKNISAEISSKIDDTNAKLEQVSELNDRIFLIESNGSAANAARDQRDILLQDLAETMGATSYDLANGMVNVQLPSGLPLVNGNTASTIEADETGDQVTLKLKSESTVRDLTGHTIGGEFSGLLQMRDEFIPSLEGQLDQMAYSVINTVNDLHKAGAGLDGTTDNLFFAEHNNPSAPVGEEWRGAARNMEVAITDPNKIAAAKAPAAGTNVLVGDNTNALSIAALGQGITIDGTDSFDSFYGKIVSQLGVASKENQLNRGGAEDALVQVKNLRDSQAGVSLDEEMIDLMQFQRNFQSSAKYLSIVDELMGELINLKR